MLKQLRCL